MAAMALAGTLGCSTPEEGPEPELIAETTAEIVELKIADDTLYWAGGRVEKVSINGGEVTDLGGEEACAIATDGQWVYRVDDSEVVFTPTEGGTPSLLTSKDYASGRRPQCRSLAVAGGDVYTVMGHHDSVLVNAPVGVSGMDQRKLGGDVWTIVADEDAVYYQIDGQLLKLEKASTEPVVLVERAIGVRLRAGKSHIYWQEIESDDTSSRFIIRRVHKDGGEVQTVTVVEGGCGFFGQFEVDDEFVYFGFNMDRDGGWVACHGDDVVAIAKAPLTGGDPIIISAQASMHFPEHFVTNDSHIFFTECFGIDEGCQLYSVPK